MADDKAPKTDRPVPHTEVRRKDQGAASPRPKVAPPRAAEDEDDKLDDLFNDLPV